jgi:hypothetical protein
MKKCVLVLMVLAAVSATKALADYDTNVGSVDFYLTTTTLTQPILAGGDVLGPYQYTFSDATGGNNPINTTLAPVTTTGFCVDFATPIDAYPATYNGASVYKLTGNGIDSSAANIQALNTAEAKVLQMVGNYVQTNTVPPPLGYGVGSQDNALGLQMALWSVINGVAIPAGTTDGSLPSAFQSGISATDANLAITAANAFVNSTEGYVGGSPPTVYAIVTAGDDQIQGLVFQDQLGNDTLPEPAGLISIASLGLCGLPIGARAWYRRRRGIA